MIARHVVAARTLIEGTRARRRQVAMARTAIALAVAEDREVTGIIRVVAYLGVRGGARLIDEGADKARARKLRHPVHADFGFLEFFRAFVDLDRLGHEAADRRLHAHPPEERAT